MLTFLKAKNTNIPKTKYKQPWKTVKQYIYIYIYIFFFTKNGHASTAKTLYKNGLQMSPKNQNILSHSEKIAKITGMED